MHSLTPFTTAHLSLNALAIAGLLAVRGMEDAEGIRERTGLRDKQIIAAIIELDEAGLMQREHEIPYLEAERKGESRTGYYLTTVPELPTLAARPMSIQAAAVEAANPIRARMLAQHDPTTCGITPDDVDDELGYDWLEHLEQPSAAVEPEQPKAIMTWYDNVDRHEAEQGRAPTFGTRSADERDDATSPTSAAGVISKWAGKRTAEEGESYADPFRRPAAPTSDEQIAHQIMTGDGFFGN